MLLGILLIAAFPEIQKWKNWQLNVTDKMLLPRSLLGYNLAQHKHVRKGGTQDNALCVSQLWTLKHKLDQQKQYLNQIFVKLANLGSW